MKVVALISGGKDSCYNMIQCVVEGHDIVALANVRPVGKDELDSYMFQTVGHQAIDLYAAAMDLPLFREDITGTAIMKDKDYQPLEGDEVEDLYKLLKKIKSAVNVEGVSVGAILSNYQRVRVENVCSRLGLTCLGYLWRRDQVELLDEMINAKIDAILIKVAALGLDSRHLGKTLSEIKPHMAEMREKYQLNPCGEGGEYETFTLDCPLFNKRIVIDEYEVIRHDSDPFSPVSFLSFKKMHVEDKELDDSQSLMEKLKQMNIKKGSQLLQELGNPHLKTLQYSSKPPDEEKLPTLIPDEEEHGGPEVHLKVGVLGFSWVSGILAYRSSDSSITEPVKSAFDSLKDVLSSRTIPLSSVVLVYIHCQDLSEFSAVNSVMIEFFRQNPPARVCVGASSDRDIIFSMDCLVYHPSNVSAPLQRNTLHVQGISHWAPANVGPYSQSIQVGPSFYCAGMLPLCPSSMTLIEGGIHAENVLCFRSIERVLQAMDASLRIRDIVSAVCFVTESKYISVAKEDLSTALRENRRNDELDNSTGEPIVCYVVVNRLPRNVSVEWHVIAMLAENRKQHYERRITHNNVSVNLKCFIDKASGQGFALMNVEVTNALSSIKLQPVLKDLVDALKNLLEEKSCPWESILAIRLYYPHQLVKLKDIFSTLRTSLRQYMLELPAVTCVPVKGLDKGHILSLCIHLQDQGQLGQDENDL